VRVALLLMTEARHRAAARLFGASRDDSFLLTVIAFGALAGAMSTTAATVRSSPSVGDMVMGAAVVKSTVHGIAGGLTGDTPLCRHADRLRVAVAPLPPRGQRISARRRGILAPDPGDARKPVQAPLIPPRRPSMPLVLIGARPMADGSAPAAGATPGPRPRALLVLLALAAIVGVGVSLAAWCFLELIHQIQTWVFTDIPKDLGYHNGAPMWFYLVILGLAGVVAAFAIVRLPGKGGHIPAEGLKVGGAPTQPIELPGIVLAALATIGLGLVLGPEAPLIALGAGLGLWAIRTIRSDTPDQAQAVIAASGSFAAMSMIFGSAIIAAVILLKALGLDRERLPLLRSRVCWPPASARWSRSAWGSLTGLSSSAYALGPLALPSFARPDVADFAWTIPLGIVIAMLCYAVRRIGLETLRVVPRRPLLLVPAAGIVVALLAIAFHATSGHSVNAVLFSGQDALPTLVSAAGSWSISALLLVIAFKGAAWGCRSVASAAARHFPPCSSAPPSASWPRIRRGSHSPRRRVSAGRGRGVHTETSALGGGARDAAGQEERRGIRTADHRGSRHRLPDHGRPRHGSRPRPRGVRSCNTRPGNSGPGDASAIPDARQLDRSSPCNQPG